MKSGEGFLSLFFPKGFPHGGAQARRAVRAVRYTYGKPPPLSAKEVLSGEQGPSLTFFHPDCTVGPGVSPDRGEGRPWSLVGNLHANLSDSDLPSRAIPPIGNWKCRSISQPQILTLPRRSLTQARKFITRDAGSSRSATGDSARVVRTYVERPGLFAPASARRFGSLLPPHGGRSKLSDQV